MSLPKKNLILLLVLLLTFLNFLVLLRANLANLVLLVGSTDLHVRVLTHLSANRRWRSRCLNLLILVPAIHGLFLHGHDGLLHRNHRLLHLLHLLHLLAYGLLFLANLLCRVLNARLLRHTSRRVRHRCALHLWSHRHLLLIPATFSVQGFSGHARGKAHQQRQTEHYEDKVAHLKFVLHYILPFCRILAWHNLKRYALCDVFFSNKDNEKSKCR